MADFPGILPSLRSVRIRSRADRSSAWSAVSACATRNREISTWAPATVPDRRDRPLPRRPTYLRREATYPPFRRALAGLRQLLQRDSARSGGDPDQESLGISMLHRFVDDDVDHAETQACAFATFLRREEGLEYPAHLQRHPGAGVDRRMTTSPPVGPVASARRFRRMASRRPSASRRGH